MDDREALGELIEEQAALRRVATLAAVERDPGQVFAAVAEEAGRRLSACASNLLRFEGEDEAVVVGMWSKGNVPTMPLGTRELLDSPTVSTAIRRTGRAARVDDFSGLPGTLAESLRGLGLMSGVGAPVTVGGELWGALIVSSMDPHDFPPAAEQRVAQFGELAAAAVAEAAGRERLRRLADEQAALRRVATLVAVEHDSEALFAAITEETGRILGAWQANLARFVGEREALVVGAWTAPGGTPGIGSGERVTLDGQTAAGQVHDTGCASRVDDYERRSGPLVDHLLDLGLRSAVGAPVRVGGELWGALIVSSERRHAFDAETERRAEDFAELVATALAEADAREQLAASRARLVEASYDARRRIERDLHDGAQQRLVGLALDLRRAETEVERAPESAPELLREARASLDEALAELRELARGIHPAVLTERGLEPALEALGARSPVPVCVEASLPGRPPPAVEAAAYFVVSEALANVAKYAGASSVEVRVAGENGALAVTVADDGEGGADPAQGSGLRGLRDRVEALGGRFSVSSPSGRGTTVIAELPVR